ncbi:MAG TPA: hypothetical protein VK742_06640 [Candidatus Sulfotelmatobacter sp.]|jgi:hypothetical protein|nr:hypothetical protein [Candidatus Sulfotelmatobacter sp.]
MKKRSTIFLALAALVVGGAIGNAISSHYSGQMLQFQIVAASLKGVSDSYKPLKLLRNGDTTNAADVLQTQMNTALQRVDLVAQAYNRPDMLTNASVVNAKALK